MKPRNKSELIKIAMITDFHLDWDYTPGAMSVGCGNVLCCRIDSGPGTKPENTAGKWGDFACDVPIITL